MCGVFASSSSARFFSLRAPARIPLGARERVAWGLRGIALLRLLKFRSFSSSSAEGRQLAARRFPLRGASFAFPFSFLFFLFRRAITLLFHADGLHHLRLGHAVRIDADVHRGGVRRSCMLRVSSMRL